MTISSDDAKSIFNDLYRKKDDIEAIVGARLDWREMLDRKASRVVLSNPVDPNDENSWLQQFAWLQDILEKFDKAFRPLFVSKIAQAGSG